MAKIPNGIAHHDPDSSSDLQGLQDKVEALMDQAVGEEAPHTRLVVDERRYWQKSKEEEAAKGALAADICIDVGKTEQQWMGHVIAGHDGNIYLIRRQNDT